MTEAQVRAAKTLGMLRDGAILVVWNRGRLGRRGTQLIDLIGELHEQGIQFTP